MPGAPAGLMPASRTSFPALRSNLQAAEILGGTPGAEPEVVLDRGDWYVVAKPSGWETDARAPLREKEPEAHHSLVAFLVARFAACGRGAPILRDREHRHGILHRLDANSSGLILGALSYAGYYELQVQLDARQVQREYVVLVHGCVPPQVTLVNARVRSGTREDQRSVVAKDGKPAATRVKVVAHLARDTPSGTAVYTLAVLSLLTGRTHQIRAHMQHLGHPVVCDAKYTAPATFDEDLCWCPQNFLHRYRVSVCVSNKASLAPSGVEQVEAVQQLPSELAKVLARLRPVGDASVQGIRPWLQLGVQGAVSGSPAAPGASRLPRYADHCRLPGPDGTPALEAVWPPQGQPPGPRPAGPAALAWGLLVL